MGSSQTPRRVLITGGASGIGLAVVVHFRRARDVRIWRTLVAPGLSFLGLVGVVTLAVINFPVLAGSDAFVITLLPWRLLVALVGGLGYAAHLRANEPEIYDALNEDLERAEM